MNHPPYSDYKPSGVAWLGGIPAHWEVKRLRYCLKKTPARHSSDLPTDTPVSFVPMDAVGEYGGMRLGGERDVGDIGSGYTYFEDGDVVVAKITPCFENGKGALAAGLCNGVAYGTTELHVLRPGIGMEQRFLFYLSISQPFRKIGEAMMYGAGGQKRVPEEFVKNFQSGVPPVVEQSVIADFLDRETARIDRLVAKKHEFIDRLKEKRAALITQAVTRGLDPNALMKDSGVAWLGEIPVHWKTRPIKYLAHVGNGSTPQRDNEDYWWGGEFPWLNSAVVNHEQVNEGADFVTDIALRECHLPIINPPAVLVGITGQGKTRGMATTLKIVATINQHLAYLKPIGAICSTDYLRRVMDVAYSYLRSESDGGGSTKGAITCEQIAHMKIPVPPLIEQEAITTELCAKLVATSDLIDKVESAIEKLTEYRSALITAAVTGKIDVRNTQAEAA